MAQEMLLTSPGPSVPASIVAAACCCYCRSPRDPVEHHSVGAYLHR